MALLKGRLGQFLGMPFQFYIWNLNVMTVILEKWAEHWKCNFRWMCMYGLTCWICLVLSVGLCVYNLREVCVCSKLVMETSGTGLIYTTVIPLCTLSILPMLGLFSFICFPSLKYCQCMLPFRFFIAEVGLKYFDVNKYLLHSVCQDYSTWLLFLNRKNPCY